MPRCEIVLAIVLLIASYAIAQEAQSDADKSRELLRNQMELRLHEEEVALGLDDDDLGEQILVKRKPKPWHVGLSSDLGETWSSNVLQADRERRTDFALTHNDVVTGTYKLTDELTFSGSYRFSLFRYNRLIFQNFDAHNASGSFNYVLPENFSLNTGLQWTTIYSTPVGDSVYEEADWSIGATKVIPLNFADWIKDKAAWFIAYQTDVRLTSPNDFDKLEVSPLTGISYLVAPKVITQAVYRWQYQHFQRGGRKDYNNMISGNISWNPFTWLTLSAFCGWTHNNSVGSTRDYDAFNTGTTVKFAWTF